MVRRQGRPSQSLSSDGLAFQFNQPHLDCSIPRVSLARQRDHRERGLRQLRDKHSGRREPTFGNQGTQDYLSSVAGELYVHGLTSRCVGVCADEDRASRPLPCLISNTVD